MSVERETLREELIQTIGPALQPADRAMVDDLLELRALASERLALFRENPLAIGSRKQQVAHPALGEYLALQARILATSEALGVTPRARGRARASSPADIDIIAELGLDGD